MPNRPSEVRKETFGHDSLLDPLPYLETRQTDGFSYTPAMDPWYHGIKVEDYAYLKKDPAWCTPAYILEKPYDVSPYARNVFELKTSPSAEPMTIAVSYAEAIHLGRDPRFYDQEALDTVKKHRERMEFPPFEAVPNPPEPWRIADTYRQTVLQDHRKAIDMLRHAMFFFTSTPSKAKDEHKVELAQLIRTEVWQPMVTAAARARGLTDEEQKVALDALDSKLFFIGKSSERKKIWKAMLDGGESYVINKQRLFEQYSRKWHNR